MKQFEVLLLAIGALTAPAQADVLDGLVFGLKCMGADDPEACKARSKHEADESRERLRRENAAAGSAQGATRGERADQCHTVKANGKVDIDIAYARGKTYFGFMSLDEKKRRTNTYIRMDDGFKHTVVPGTLYDMWDRVSVDAPNSGRQYFYAGLRLMKSEQGTELDAEYCITPSQSGLTAYLDKAFVGLVQSGK